ncbi:MAG: universal stress protein [Gammaproteobacteria bacterium]
MTGAGHREATINPYRQIVCATDFSEASQRACIRATEITARFGARLTLLHAVDDFPEDRSNEVIAPEDKDPRRYRESETKERLTEMTHRVGCQKAGRAIRFTTQSSWHEIVRFARDAEVDLAVLADHEHHTPWR